MMSINNEAAGWKEWSGLAVLALPTMLLSLDFTVLHLALPQLAADLQPGSTQQLWILDIYGFMIAGFLVTMGTLGDRIGRKKLLMIGAAAFGLCSVMAAFAVSAEMLIVARALLGIAGATLMPSTLSLISNMFKLPAQRSIAIAVWISCFSIGGAIGPLVGGLMLEWFWWGSVFLLGVPVMVLLLATAPALLPEYRSSQASRLDFTSVLLSLTAMLSIIYGFKEIAKQGLTWPSVVFIVAGCIAAFVFVRRQRLLAEPLVDLQLFRNRSFNGALLSMLVALLTLSAFVLFFAQYLQLVYGLSPLLAGLWMIPHALTNIVGALITPVLASRLRPAYVIAGGLAIAVTGFLMFLLVEPSGGLGTMIAISVILTLGLTPLMMLSTNLVVASAPPEKTGSASSLSETCSELGMALGVAVFGSIGAAVYRRQMAGQIADTIPPQAAEEALGTLAGAAAAADALGSGHAGVTAMMEAAREAFVVGMHMTGMISAALLAILLVCYMTLLRNVQTNM